MDVTSVRKVKSFEILNGKAALTADSINQCPLHPQATSP